LKNWVFFRVGQVALLKYVFPAISLALVVGNPSYTCTVSGVPTPLELVLAVEFPISIGLGYPCVENTWGRVRVWATRPLDMVAEATLGHVHRYQGAPLSPVLLALQH